MKAATKPADTPAITRAEAELFREALNHLPGFVGDVEQEAMLSKLRAFLETDSSPSAP